MMIQVHVCIQSIDDEKKKNKKEKIKNFNTSLTLPLPTSTNSIVDAARTLKFSNF